MGPIKPSERLWRSVFREKRARAVQDKRSNQHGKLVFVEESAGTGISVDRYDFVSLDTATAQGDRIAVSVKDSKGVHGWATVTHKAASGMARSVTYTPTDDNIYHADIFLPEVDQDGWEDAETHAIDLLLNCEWVPRLGDLPATAS